MISKPQIADDAHRDLSLSPAPLDCNDLAATFRTNMADAFDLLLTLTLAQFNLQALAYAAYLNQSHCLDLNMDDILAGWQRGLGF
jgi:hypothetical protein